MTAHRLLLLRHAEAGFGGSDKDRPLSPRGRSQAEDVGQTIRLLRPSRVWCSPTKRTLETAELLAIGLPLEIKEDLYHGHADGMIASLAALEESDESVLLVAHAPGVPDVVHELAAKDSDADAMRTLSMGFPACTLAVIAFDGEWTDVPLGRVILARRSPL